MIRHDYTCPSLPVKMERCFPSQTLFCHLGEARGVRGGNKVTSEVE